MSFYYFVIRKQDYHYTINLLFFTIIIETGSGKTLAFGLVIINYILQNASINTTTVRVNEAVAIIVAPTRELALQITKVLKDVCNPFKDIHPISIVSVVGGMSEQKQRRLLGPHSRPPDIIVGTPGRLCEMIQDNEIVTFQDMSRLRYLVVDEADRIVEEGHFPELHRLFSRIRDHEKLAVKGLDPRSVEKANRIGTYDDDYLLPVSKKSNKSIHNTNNNEADEDAAVTGSETNDNENDDEEEEVPEFPLEDDIYDFEPMPTESEIEHARLTQTYDDIYNNNQHEEEDTNDEDIYDSNMTAVYKSARQTLLYSATAISLTNGHNMNKKNKKNKKIKNNSKNLLSEKLQQLPQHLQE